MKRFIFLCCLCLSFSVSAFCYTANDSVLFNVNDALINGSKVYIPVSFSSADSIHALDFAIKFDDQIMSFDSIINLTPGLQYLYYLNPNDSVLRFTSNHFDPLVSNSPLVQIVFNVNTIQVCANDIDSITTFLNGDNCTGAASGCTYLTALTNPQNNSVIQLYPNPASDRIEIKSPKPDFIIIYDINGKRVPVTTTYNEDHLTIYLNRVSNGIYFCHLSIDNTVYTRKFVISR